MKFFEFSQNLLLGIDEMDDEHRHLIQLMNELIRAKAEGKGRETLGRAFDALVDYTRKHFADEEAYLARIKYPDLSVHKMIHQDLLKKLSVYYDAFKVGADNVDESLFSFLKIWLSAHIRGIDQKYARTVKGVA